MIRQLANTIFATATIAVACTAGSAHAAHHVLAEDDDARIALHFLEDRVANGITVHHLRHGSAPPFNS